MKRAVSSRRDRSMAPAELVVATVLAGALVLVPLAMLLITALRGPADYLPFEPQARWTTDNLKAFYANRALMTRMLPDTLAVVVGTVVLASSLAFTLAWLIERTDLPWRSAAYVLVLFPLLIPVNILAVAWIYLMGPNAGWLNLALRPLFGITGSGPINIFSMGGLILCQSLALTPYIFVLMLATLRGMNPALEEASATSGASNLTTFRRVTLPVLLPGLLAPVILAAIIALEQFELPLMIGLPARLNIFAYRIYYELNPADGLPNYGAAAVISLVFLLFAAILLYFYNRAIRNASRFTTITGKSFRQKRLPLGRWRIPALIVVALYVAMAAVLPVLVLVWTSLNGFTPPSFEALPQASLKAYRSLFADQRFWTGLRNTLIVASLSALVVTVLGAALALIIVRTKLWWRGIVDFMSFMSIGIPSVIVGVAVMILFLSVPLGLYGTIWILVVAYSYRLATTTRTARAGLTQIHPELEEASAAAGAPWGTTQRRITLPLLSPALLSAYVLLFIIGAREFTIPLVLASDENVVLSVLVWRLYQGGQSAETAALAVLFILAVIPVLALVRSVWVRSGGGA
jgi:iron(III) transport system permease protein